jgi:hypothetical protein
LRLEISFLPLVSKVVEVFQQGEDTAKELAAQILRDIETQYRKQVAGK